MADAGTSAGAWRGSCTTPPHRRPTGSRSRPRPCAAPRRRGPGRDRLIEPLDFILQLADVALAETRALIFGLRPASLAREGLTAGLQPLTPAVAARHELDLAAGAEPELDLATKEAFYRVAQEALHNVVKHAPARSVGVRQPTDGENVELRVIDDGVGFEPRADHPGHIGLDGMRKRGRALGLELAVESRPGAGTEVRLRTHAPARRRGRALPWSRPPRVGGAGASEVVGCLRPASRACSDARSRSSSRAWAASA